MPAAGAPLGPSPTGEIMFRVRAETAERMMYSRAPMETEGSQRSLDLAAVEEKLSRLEKLAENLETVPDGEITGVLEEATALLGEVNVSIEKGIEASEKEARELGDLLREVDFGPFDRALEDMEKPPGGGR